MRRSVKQFLQRKQAVADLRELAVEAQAQAIHDMQARRCFGFHKWTRWEALECDPNNWQTRHCLGCGRIQDKRR